MKFLYSPLTPYSLSEFFPLASTGSNLHRRMSQNWSGYFLFQELSEYGYCARKAVTVLAKHASRCERSGIWCGIAILWSIKDRVVYRRDSAKLSKRDAGWSPMFSDLGATVLSATPSDSPCVATTHDRHCARAILLSSLAVFVFPSHSSAATPLSYRTPQFIRRSSPREVRMYVTFLNLFWLYALFGILTCACSIRPHLCTRNDYW